MGDIEKADHLTSTVAEQTQASPPGGHAMRIPAAAQGIREGNNPNSDDGQGPGRGPFVKPSEQSKNRRLDAGTRPMGIASYQSPYSGEVPWYIMISVNYLPDMIQGVVLTIMRKNMLRTL